MPSHADLSSEEPHFVSNKSLNINIVMNARFYLVKFQQLQMSYSLKYINFFIFFFFSPNYRQSIVYKHLESYPLENKRITIFFFTSNEKSLLLYKFDVFFILISAKYPISFKNIFRFICMGVLVECIFVHHVCASCLQRSEEGIGSTGTGVKTLVLNYCVGTKHKQS